MATYAFSIFSSTTGINATFTLETAVSAATPTPLAAFYAPSGTNELVTSGNFTYDATTPTNSTLVLTVINHFGSIDSMLTPPVKSTTTYRIEFDNGSGWIYSDDAEYKQSFTVTEVTMLLGCFNEGTKILCLNHKVEEYVPIENLQSGDIVKTYKYGYRKIDLIGKKKLINNPENFKECMYKMAKTPTNGLLEDLIVTGGHSLLVDDLENNKLNEKLFNGQTLKIDDKYLLLAAASDKFEKIVGNDKYTYYHLVLENNGDNEERFGIWANGILTETPSKNFFVQSHFILL